MDGSYSRVDGEDVFTFINFLDHLFFSGKPWGGYNPRMHLGEGRTHCSHIPRTQL